MMGFKTNERNENIMVKQDQFILFDNWKEFGTWLQTKHIKRKIIRVQQHHTWSPSYKHFKGNNHFSLLISMRKYHLKNGFIDIAQNLTIFPDGKIAVCRDFEKTPAGIKGCNANALCIEIIGNFDINGDVMTTIQMDAIIGVNAVLCFKFELCPSVDSLPYHHWYDLNTGVRTFGLKGSVKTCPGSSFFYGNKKESAINNLYHLVSIKLKGLNSMAIITLENAIEVLVNKKIISSPEYWINNCVAGKKINCEYLEKLLKTATRTKSFTDAIEYIYSKFVINSPNYWLINYGINSSRYNGEYVSIMLINLANLLLKQYQPVINNEIKNIKKITNISDAITLFISKGYIKSPDYWKANCKPSKKVIAEYLIILLGKVTGEDTITKIIDYLYSNFIIDTKDYWIKNLNEKNELNGEYVSILLTNLANFIS